MKAPADQNCGVAQEAEIRIGRGACSDLALLLRDYKRQAEVQFPLL